MSFKTTYILFGILVALIVIFALAIYNNPDSSETSLYVLPSMYKPSDPMKDSDVDHVEIERNRPEAEKQKIVFVRDKEGNRWELVLGDHHLRASRSAVEALVRQVHGAKRDDKTDPLTDMNNAELAPPTEVITLKKGDRTVTLNVGKISPGGDETAVVYVTSSDIPKTIMAVKKWQLDTVFKKLNEFRDQDLLAPSAEDVSSVSVEEGKKPALALKKSDGDRWLYVKPDYGRASYEGRTAPPPVPGAPAKAPDGVRDLLDAISSNGAEGHRLRVEKPEDFVEDNARDLAKYNLDAAKADVLKIAIERTDEITTTDGKKEKKTSPHVLLVAVSKKVDDKSDQYYACLEEDHNVVKLPAKHIETIRKMLDDTGAFRDRNLVEVASRKSPDAIDVKKGAEKVLELRQLPNFGGWKLYQGETPYAVDETAVQGLISMLTQKNTIEKFVDDPKEKAALMAKPDPTVSVWIEGIAPEKDEDKEKDKDKDKDKPKEEAPKERKAGKPKLKEGAVPAVVLRFGDVKGPSVAVERTFAGEKQGTVVLVSAKLLDQVRQGPVFYLDRKVPTFATGFPPFTDVTRLVLQRGSAVTEVVRDKKESPWKILKPESQKDRDADPAVVERILQDLNILRAETVVTEKADADKLKTEYGIPGANRASVTITKDGKPQTYDYDFGKEVGMNAVYLKASQAETVYQVSNSILNNLSEEVQDKSLWHFDVAKVREVKISGWQDLGSVQEVVLKHTSKDEWIAEKGLGPDAKVNLANLQALVGELSNLRADRFVEHKATPTATQALDVNKGAMRIEVSVEGGVAAEAGKPSGEAKFDILVGAEDDKHKGSYFAISNKLPGTIFEVRKQIFEGPRSKPSYFRLP